MVAEIVALERSKAMLEARVMYLTAALADRADGWFDPRDPVVDGRLSGAVVAAAELAPALKLAPVTAALRVDRACRLRDRLPLTLAAMSRGELHLGRVLAIDEATRPLEVDAAGRVERLVLPRAVRQTAGELRAALRRAVIVVDPGGAEERRKVAVRGRRVARYAREDGTAALEAVLSAVDTGEIYDLVDEVARRTKTAEDARSMDARRADALVWLVLGRDPQLGPQDSPPRPTGPDPAHHDSRDDDGFLPEGAPVRDDHDDHDALDDHDAHDHQTAHDDRDERGEGSCDGGDADGAEAGWSQWPDAAEAAWRDAALNGFDRAGEARVARISELAVLASSAMTCRRPQRPRWVTINQVRCDGTAVAVGELDGYGPLTHQAAPHLLYSGACRPPDPPSGRTPTPAQAATHDPPGWLDRDIRARDGTCRFPGCRQSARRGDVDHTIAFPAGATVRANLGVLCRRHHRIKHAGTWTVHQDERSRYTWTSTVTGRTYTTHPRGTTGTWQGATTWPH